MAKRKKRKIILEVKAENFAMACRMARLRIKATQMELGEILGVSPSSISTWEKGIREPAKSIKLIVFMLASGEMHPEECEIEYE